MGGYYQRQATPGESAFRESAQQWNVVNQLAADEERRNRMFNEAKNREMQLRVAGKNNAADIEGRTADAVMGRYYSHNPEGNVVGIAGTFNPNPWSEPTTQAPRYLYTQAIGNVNRLINETDPSKLTPSQQMIVQYNKNLQNAQQGVGQAQAKYVAANVALHTPQILNTMLSGGYAPMQQPAAQLQSNVANAQQGINTANQGLAYHQNLPYIQNSDLMGAYKENIPLSQKLTYPKR